MGKNSRKECLAKIRVRYRKAGRREKGAILSEFCAVCGCDRKYAVRILNARKEEGSSPQARPQAGLRPGRHNPQKQGSPGWLIMNRLRRYDDSGKNGLAQPVAQ